MDFEVVWSGRDPLLPDRAEHWDDRYDKIISYDLDEADAVVEKARRQYTRTGRYKGAFSRTNPAASQYKPSLRVNRQGVR